MFNLKNQIMKKMKMIEGPKMDLHPQHTLSPDAMAAITGGAGCVCNKNNFNINHTCVCNKKKFGFCSKVTGGNLRPVEPVYPGDIAEL